MLAVIQEKLLTLVLPLVLAPLVMVLTQKSKEYLAWVDRQHPIVKQGVAAGWAAILTALAAAVGKSVCTDGAVTCDLAGVDWRVVLTWAVATALHGWKKPKQEK